MFITYHRNLFLRFPALLGALLLAATLLPGSFAQAHDDPGGCFSNGVTLSIAVYRADGVTPVGGGSVQSGETIKYGATLTHAASSNCNFEGGNLTITTPDATPHVVASGVGIPLISSGSPFIAPQQSYVVNESDVSGAVLTAVVNYSGGTSHTPTQHQNAQAQVDISNLYQDTTLEVIKTATPAFTNTFTWEIDKSVTPAVWHLFTGDSGVSEYTVALTKVGPVAGSHMVSGSITIHNPALFASAEITSVSDMISGVGAAVVNCGVSFPHLLAPGADLVCTYGPTPLPDGTTRTNSATVVTGGDVGGGSDDATIDFSAVIPSVVGGSVTVNDTNGDSWNFDASGSQTYTKVFTCDEDEGVHNNTATIVQTQQSDSASVTVHCHDISVTKSATTSFDRKYEWTIEKTGDADHLNLVEGQHHLMSYEVTVDALPPVDSNWQVSGTITVHNSHPSRAASLLSVIDVVSPAINAIVSCPSLSVPAGGNLVCTYGPIPLPNGTNRTNTATATMQNYSFDKNGVPTPSGTTDASGNANVTFGSPSNVIDEEIEVTDSFAGVLGTVNAAAAPKTFEYTRDIFFAGEGACDEHVIENIAEFVTNDSHATGSDGHTVTVMVTCGDECVHDATYWKNHSHKGPGTYDNGWSNLGPLEENTIFFLSGKTWYQVFQTPAKQYIYYQLAHQYMTAKLNMLNGAEVPPDVANALTKAEDWFAHITPQKAAGIKGLTKLRPLMLLNDLLRDYNSGCHGPENCECITKGTCVKK